MTKAPAEHLGILRSLEILPFFAAEPHAAAGGGSEPRFRLKAFSSYGEISRAMLTGKLIGGIVPWEIFVADVLALPGQRASWKVPLFLHACPTELVLREPVYRAFYPDQAASKHKLPAKLVIGIESQNSLTKAQSRDWLGQRANGRAVELAFRMLPMDLMIHAMDAREIDGLIAPTPWGIHAETAGIGRRDPFFTPGKFAQQLVLACHRDFIAGHPGLTGALSENVAAARVQLQDPEIFERSIVRLLNCGKPAVRSGLLAQAAALHDFPTLNRDVVPDIPKLVGELMSLEDFSVLPAQVAPSEQTARLLLPA